MRSPHDIDSEQQQAWEHLHHHAARHFRRAARAAGERHRARGWPPFDPGDFGQFRGFGGWGGGRGFGRSRGRAARGDIRAAILVLLAERPSHGYQIIQELEQRSGGAWRVSPGSVYPTLQQLEDEGLVRAVTSETERRVYELTDTGRTEAARLKEGPAPWDEVAGSVGNDVRELVDLVKGVGFASWQAAHADGGAQLPKVNEILREARRRLYMLLAEESPPQTPAG